MKSFPKRFGWFHLAIGLVAIVMLVLVWVLFPMLAINNDPSTFSSEEFSSRYPDTEAAGNAAATKDIQSGVRRLMIFGLVMAGSTSEFERRLGQYGIRPIFGGCIIGGPGYQFWTGYNATVRADAKKRLNLSDAEANSIEETFVDRPRLG